MTTVEVLDDYIDGLYHARDLAYDNEDYDAVREINLALSKVMNVEEIDELDDYDDDNPLLLDPDDEEEYIFEEIDE